MYISDFLSEAEVQLDARVSSKEEAIALLVELLDRHGALTDREMFREAIMAREHLGSTGIAEGIAIPHAKHISVRKASISAIVVKDGVDFMAKDGVPARLLFMIAAPADGADLHVEMLGRLAILLIGRENREALYHAQSKEKFIAYLNRMEAKLVDGLR